MDSRWQWWIKTFGVFVLAGLITLFINYGIAKEKTSRFEDQVNQLSEKLEVFNTLVYRLETAEKRIDNHDSDIKVMNDLVIKGLSELQARQEMILQRLPK